VTPELETIGTPALWLGFLAFVLTMLVVDLGVFQRRAHTPGWREAVSWSAVWVGLALLFNLAVYLRFGPRPALEFLTGYLIEKALSVDNLFVFLVIFGYFRVPPTLQHRVLFWGILGALVMRAAFIMAGAALLHRFQWIIYVFGALLVVTGVKLLRERTGGFRPEDNRIIGLLARVLPLTEESHGARFAIRERGRWLVTPLFFTLVTVEVVDVVFAVDSIPAVFAVTRDPFIVFTSNIFAILGLRALYFLLAGSLTRLRYLNVGLAGVLVFVGGKMLLSGVAPIPVAVSLAVVAGLLGAAVVASAVWRPRVAIADPARTLIPFTGACQHYRTPKCGTPCRSGTGTSRRPTRSGSCEASSTRLRAGTTSPTRS
jgi:tellurite resistance protein TerC